MDRRSPVTTSDDTLSLCYFLLCIIQIYDEDRKGSGDLSHHDFIGQATISVGSLMCSAGESRDTHLFPASPGDCVWALTVPTSMRVTLESNGEPSASKSPRVCRPSPSYWCVNRPAEDAASHHAALRRRGTHLDDPRRGAGGVQRLPARDVQRQEARQQGWDVWKVRPLHLPQEMYAPRLLHRG